MHVTYTQLALSVISPSVNDTFVSDSSTKATSKCNFDAFTFDRLDGMRNSKLAKHSTTPDEQVVVAGQGC